MLGEVYCLFLLEGHFSLAVGLCGGGFVLSFLPGIKMPDKKPGELGNWYKNSLSPSPIDVS